MNSNSSVSRATSSDTQAPRNLLSAEAWRTAISALSGSGTPSAAAKTCCGGPSASRAARAASHDELPSPAASARSAASISPLTIAPSGPARYSWTDVRSSGSVGSSTVEGDAYTSSSPNSCLATSAPAARMTGTKTATISHLRRRRLGSSGLGTGWSRCANASEIEYPLIGGTLVSSLATMTRRNPHPWEIPRMAKRERRHRVGFVKLAFDSRNPQGGSVRRAPTGVTRW